MLASIPKPQDPELIRYEEEKRREHQQKIDTYLVIMAESNIPKRHNLFESSSSTDPEWDKKYCYMKERLNKRGIFIFCGPRGTGKTQMTACLMKVFVKSNLLSAKYCSIMDIFIALKATYNGEGKEHEVLHSFVRPALLVIDECHERSESKWENTMFTHLIDKRYACHKLCTILISNLMPDALLASLGASILDRANETGGVVAFDNVRNFRSN